MMPHICTLKNLTLYQKVVNPGSSSKNGHMNFVLVLKILSLTFVISVINFSYYPLSIFHPLTKLVLFFILLNYVSYVCLKCLF